MASTVTNGFLGLATAMSGKRRKPKLTEPEDFINKDFKKLMKQVFRDNEARPSKQSKQGGWASHIADAKAKGLKGPWSSGKSHERGER